MTLTKDGASNSSHHGNTFAERASQKRHRVVRKSREVVEEWLRGNANAAAGRAKAAQRAHRSADRGHGRGGERDGDLFTGARSVEEEIIHSWLHAGVNGPRRWSRLLATRLTKGKRLRRLYADLPERRMGGVEQIVPFDGDDRRRHDKHRGVHACGPARPDAAKIGGGRIPAPIAFGSIDGKDQSVNAVWNVGGDRDHVAGYVI